MKKLLALALALIFCLPFAACGNDSSGSSDKITIGIAQVEEHLSLDTIRESFIEEMAALGYGEDKVEFIYKNAQADQNNLNSICQQFVGDDVDLIVAIATPTAQAAATATKEIPILFSAVTDPVLAKLVDSMDAPGGNVTGTSDYIACDKIFDLALQITPDVQTFGLIYNTSESNSLSVIEEAKAYLDEKGISYVESPVTNTSEVQQAMNSFVGKVDAVFAPIDNTVAKSMSVVTDVSRKNNLPVYVSADSMVSDGGLATIGIDYTVLGKETAAMAKEILEGADPAQVPVRVMSDVSTYINVETAQAIGVEIPQEILDSATLFGNQ